MQRPSIAATASVQVQNAMRVVRYESVMHIVSEVYGSKPRGVSAFEVLGTIFPAGTLSGSPKIRAPSSCCGFARAVCGRAKI